MNKSIDCSSANLLMTLGVENNETLARLKEKMREKERFEIRDPALSYRSDQKILDGFNNRETEDKDLKTKKRAKTSKITPERKKTNQLDKPYFENFKLQKEELLPRGYSSIEELQQNYYKQKEEKLKKDLCLWEVSTIGMGYPMLIEVSRDYKYLFGAVSQFIKVWDIATRQEVCTFENIHVDEALFMAVSNNSEYIAAGAYDKSVKLFEISSQKEITHFTDMHDHEISAAIFTSDDKYLITGSQDGSIRIIDIQEKKVVHHFKKAHKNQVLKLIVTHNNKNLISSSADCTIKMYNLETEAEVHHFEDAHSDQIPGLAVTSDNKYLVSGSYDQSIKIFNLETKTLEHHFKEVHGNWINSVVISSDDKYIISGAFDKSMKILNLQTRVEVYHFKDLHKMQVLSVAVSNTCIFSSSYDNTIRMVHFETKPELKGLYSVHQDHVSSLTVSDGKIISAGKDMKIKIHDKESYDLIEEFLTTHYQRIWAIAVTSNNKYLISVSDDRSIKIMNLENKETKSLDYIFEDSVVSLAISPDDKHFVSGSDDTTLKIFEIETGTEIYHFKNIHEESVTAVSYTPDNRYIVSGSGDKCIKIFSVETKAEVHQFNNAHKNTIKTLVITKNSRYIISGAGDRSIKIFDIETKAVIYEFKEIHEDWVNCLALSSDNKYLVSGSFDKSIKVFDLENKSLIYHYKNIHKDWIRSIAITKDNKKIISGSHDGSIKMLLMPFAETEQELNFVSLNTSPFSSFGTYFEILLSNLHDPKVINAYQDLYILPHKWTILHLLAITDPSRIEEIPSYSDFKLPFLVDNYQKTPLHYLFAHHKVDYNAANIVLKYIIDFLEDKEQQVFTNYQKICDSISSLLPFMMMKMKSNLVSQYLNLCFVPTPTPFNDPLLSFGEPQQTYTFTQSFVILPEVRNKIVKEGDQQIDYKTSLILSDYNPVSDDVLQIVTHLIHVDKEEIFQSPVISHFIEYIWYQIHGYMLVLAALYSILMLLITTYIAIGERNLALETVILCMTTVFIACEVFQILALGKKYWRSIWNPIDNMYLFLVIAYIIARYVNEDDYDPHPLHESWMSSIIIIIGYVRWVSYLRLFSSTRSLIQIILSILSDMRGFMLILVFITIGFSIVFLEFKRDDDYSVHLYSTYMLLYGNFDDSEYELSQKLFLCLILFLLNVVLLNMLISIMGDTYGRTQEKKILTDSLTRLEMIQEALILMRIFRSKKRVSKKGYLIFCGPESEGEDSSNHEEKIQMMKKLLKQSEEKMYQVHHEVKQEISTVKQEVNQVRQNVKALEQLVTRNHEDMINALKMMNKIQ